MYQIERYVSANAVGAAVLLEGILERRDRIRKVVVASSMSLYGEGAYRAPDGSVVAPPIRSDADLAARRFELRAADGAELVPIATPEEKPLQPTSIYAITKRDHEEMFLAVGAAYDIPVVALRYFNVYGTRQALSNPYTGVLAIFASRYLNGRPPLVNEDGRQRRDFVSVKDVARACRLALEVPAAAGEVLNVGSGRSFTVLEVAERLAAAIGCEDVEPEVTERYRVGDIRHCFADIGKARRLLGFAPRVTFEAGMAELIAWLRQQTAEDRVDAATAELAARGLTR
jgi:dTDP-L-rhamnose 4-epimerase